MLDTVRRIAVSLIICVLLFTGCSSKKEVRDRAFVQAVGIENDDAGNILVTVRIFDDDRTYTGSGKDFFNALDDAQQKQEKYFFTGHIEVVLSSADENENMLEEMIKSHDIPLSCWFLSVENAADVISSADCSRLAGIIKMKTEKGDFSGNTIWESYRTIRENV